jgi:CHAT domain-containing protein
LRRHLETLGALVLKPLADDLTPARRWVIGPDAALWRVPWAALPLADGHYAVEGHAVSTVVSGRDLVRADGPASAGRPLVMADPDYDRAPTGAGPRPDVPSAGSGPEVTRGAVMRSVKLPQVPRLPATAEEARAILPNLRRYAGGLEPQVYTGADALEGTFKAARRPRVVVVSTHGFFLTEPTEPGPAGKLPANPLLRCGLTLAGCNKREEWAAAGEDDGVLTGLEVVGTDLRGCELVVMSACNTGVGLSRDGEGVAGLRQAFLLAGARSVAATLWPVEDQATAKLVTDFFARLADGKDQAEALREAQLALIRDRRASRGAAHPLFWAAFTLTGR